MFLAATLLRTSMIGGDAVCVRKGGSQ